MQKPSQTGRRSVAVRRLPALLGLIALVCGLASAPSLAQSYPSKPIRMVVPFAAGGPADTTARTLAPRLTEALGQPFVIDYKPGGNSVITQFLPSTVTVPRTVSCPRPVVMYSRNPAVPMTVAPQPQSGPGISFINVSSVVFGLANSARQAAMISRGLCAGTLVAQPSAMPTAPLHSSTGHWAGSIVGSIHSPSNVGTIGTAWSSSSAVSAAPGADSRVA